MIITKKATKYYVISELLNGYLYTKTYIDYPRAEAIKHFKNKIKMLTR